MTSLVRFSTGAGPRVGTLSDEQVTPLDVGSMADLLGQRRIDIEALIDATAPGPDSIPASQVQLLAPIDGQTVVWAAGVTYTISRDARIEESQVQDVYSRVYDADRPELFYKAAATQVMTDGDPVGRRDDSDNDTPEPELALVINRHGEVIAYTACNDMSSRSIEGENPLYLPQAKMYAGSCVVAPTLRLAREVDDPLDLTIRMTIRRGDEVVFDDQAHTGRLHRSLDELVRFLGRAASFPHGVVLSTGTCLVPSLDQPVIDGDRVHIEIPGIGAMTNVVTPTSQLVDNTW